MDEVKNYASRIIDAEAVEEIIEAAREKTYIHKRGKNAEEKGHKSYGARDDKAIFYPEPSEEEKQHRKQRPVYEIRDEPSAKTPYKRLDADEYHRGENTGPPENEGIKSDKKADALDVRNDCKRKFYTFDRCRHHSDEGDGSGY